jgi:hypothetical protein
MDQKPQKLEVGDESVVLGRVTGTFGNRTTVVGPTDDKGNTIIQPMAAGYRAQADPTTTAIGAYAGAGVMNLAPYVAELSRLHEAMLQAPDAAEHHEAVVEVGHAADAAKKDDGPAVMRHLAAAGRWASDFATKVSASLAANLLAKAIGW